MYVQQDERSEKISRLENRFGLTKENAATLYERGQRVEQIRQEAELLLRQPLPSAFSNGLIEAFYKYAPEIAVSMWKVQLDKSATPENCTVLLELEASAYDLRDDTKWFSIVVRQHNQVLQELQVALSPSGALAEFARRFEAHCGTDDQIERLREEDSSALKSFQDAIFESVMEQPSASSLAIVGPDADRWTFSPQCNLKMTLFSGLTEEGGGGWLLKVKADHERLLAEDDPEDRPLNPTTRQLLGRRRREEEMQASIMRVASARAIVDSFESSLSMSDLISPLKLYQQFCSEGRERESDSKKSVALAYLRQLNPPSEGVAGWIDEQIKEEQMRVARRTDTLDLASARDVNSETKIELRQRFIYAKFVFDALTEHADALKQELSAGYQDD